MSKKQPLHTRVANLEHNQEEMMKSLNEMIEKHNKVVADLDVAFKAVGKNTADNRMRIEKLEDTLMIGDFKAKIAGKTDIKL